MEIKISAERIPQNTLNEVLDLYNATIDMGFNGSYTRTYANEEDYGNKIFGLNMSLNVDYMVHYICAIRKILQNYISEFECTGNSTAVAQPTISNVNGNETSLSTDINVPTIISNCTKVLDKTNADTASTSLLTTDEFFKEFKRNSIEDFASEIVTSLFKEAFYKSKTSETLTQFIVVYIKATTKPKSFNALTNLANKKLAYSTLNKVNSIVDHKFGVKTFMKFLQSIPSLDEAPETTEEVVLEKPKKPPRDLVADKVKIWDSRIQTLNSAVKRIPRNVPITEKTKIILETLGIRHFESQNNNVLRKVFDSIILFRETNIPKLFILDNSLKRYCSPQTAYSLLQKLLGSFFKTYLSNEDIEKFLKELLEMFPKQKVILATSSSSIKHNNPNQKPGTLNCFPANTKFDNFVKSVFSSKGKRTCKVLKILDYMGITNLQDDEISIIKKLCTRYLYMFNFYHPEQNYTDEEKAILEKFVNDFAKTLAPDANFISLKRFITELSKIH